jgi:hypothetical protein
MQNSLTRGLKVMEELKKVISTNERDVKVGTIDKYRVMTMTMTSGGTDHLMISTEMKRIYGTSRNSRKRLEGLSDLSLWTKTITKNKVELLEPYQTWYDDQAQSLGSDIDKFESWIPSPQHAIDAEIMNTWQNPHWGAFIIEGLLYPVNDLYTAVVYDKDMTGLPQDINRLAMGSRRPVKVASEFHKNWRVAAIAGNIPVSNMRSITWRGVRIYSRHFPSKITFANPTVQP